MKYLLGLSISLIFIVPLFGANTSKFSFKSMASNTNALVLKKGYVGIGDTNPVGLLTLSLNLASQPSFTRLMQFTLKPLDTGFIFDGKSFSAIPGQSILKIQSTVDSSTPKNIALIASQSICVNPIADTYPSGQGNGGLYINGNLILNPISKLELANKSATLKGTLTGYAARANDVPLEIQGVSRGGADYIFKFDHTTVAGANPNQLQLFFKKKTDATWSVVKVNTNQVDPNNSSKTFVISHPQKSDYYLVHGALEGPQSDVLYRGSASLKDGKATITLPSYFEALTQTKNRQVLLTLVDGFDSIKPRVNSNGTVIQNGHFEVISDDPHSCQKFEWEVKAIRKDAQFDPEPNKNDYSLHGEGPYLYLEKKETL